MSELLTGQGDVWPTLECTLTGTGRTGTTPAWAAIAYIGTSADRWLALRNRDTLICGVGCALPEGVPRSFLDAGMTALSFLADDRHP